MKAKLHELMGLIGIAGLAYGLWQIYRPLMFLFVGAVLVVSAIAIHRQNQRGVSS